MSETRTTEPVYVTIAGAAALTSLSETSIRDMIRRGELHRTQHGRRVLIRRAELLALLESRETIAPAGRPALSAV